MDREPQPNIVQDSIANEANIFEELMRCAICLQMPSKAFVCGQCNQIVCLLCIYPDLKPKARKCPVCRKKVRFCKAEHFVNNIVEHRKRFISMFALSLLLKQKEIKAGVSTLDKALEKNQEMHRAIKCQSHEIELLRQKIKEQKQVTDKACKYREQVQNQYLQLGRRYDDLRKANECLRLKLQRFGQEVVVDTKTTSPVKSVFHRNLSRYQQKCETDEYFQPNHLDSSTKYDNQSSRSTRRSWASCNSEQMSERKAPKAGEKIPESESNDGV